jgi:rod shape-determining protein MreD
MMNALFFVAVTISLIIFQTIILPSFFWFSQCFDLMIVNIIFLSLVYSHYGVILTIILIGGIMDSLSGVAFFLHIFSYLWIYLIVQLFKQFVFKRNFIFILSVSLVSVLIQQGLILFSVFIEQGREGIGQMDVLLMVKQLIWGGVLIPPGVWLIAGFRQYWMYLLKIFKKQFAHRYRD